MYPINNLKAIAKSELWVEVYIACAYCFLSCKSIQLPLMPLCPLSNYPLDTGACVTQHTTGGLLSRAPPLPESRFLPLTWRLRLKPRALRP